MSSSRGTSNSNKTAHVMNLLRKNTPQSSADPAAVEQTPTPAAPPPQTPPILTALHADAEVSSQIRDALRDALAEEERLAAAQQPSSPPMHPSDAPPIPSASEADASSQSAPISPPLSEEPPVPSTAPLPAPAAPALKPMQDLDTSHLETAELAHVPSTTEPPTISQDNPSDDAILINVMARLAEEKADKYIHLFGLCTCERCKKDVIALALNTLPPKYVVMPEWEFSIRFDMYASRYSTELTAELLQACKTVMEAPRHKIPSSDITITA